MNFFKKHPIITNLFLVVIVALLLVWGILSWLHSYTRHDKSVVVPTEVISMPVEEAGKLLVQKKLRYEVADSIYVKKATPGTVYKVLPREGTNVKEDRIIYLTVYSSSPPQISMPEIKDMSQRQALALLKSVGFENVSVIKVDGPYRDLVIGLETNGKPVYPGIRYNNNLSLTLLVSSGSSSSEDTIVSEEEQPVVDNVPDESWF